MYRKLNCFTLFTAIQILIKMSKLEKKLFTSYSFKDGISDIFWGLFLIGLGCSAFITNAGIERPFSLLIIALPVGGLFLAFKYYISRPRLGVIKFSKSRKRKRGFVLLIAVIVQIIVGVLLWLVLSKNETMENLSGFINPVTIFFFIVLFTSAIAYIYDYNRLYLIGLAIGSGIPLAEALEPTLGSNWAGLLAFGIYGFIMFCFGLYLFVKFLMDNPLNEQTV